MRKWLFPPSSLLLSPDICTNIFFFSKLKKILLVLLHLAIYILLRKKKFPENPDCRTAISVDCVQQCTVHFKKGNILYFLSQMLCTAARTNKSDFHPSNTEAALQSLTWKGLPCSLVHVGLEMELKWLTTLVIIGACLASRGEPKDFKSWLEHGCRSICSGIQAPTFILSLWRAHNWVEGGNQAFLTWTLPWKIMRKTEMKRNVSWLCWLFFLYIFILFYF